MRTGSFACSICGCGIPATDAFVSPDNHATPAAVAVRLIKLRLFDSRSFIVIIYSKFISLLISSNHLNFFDAAYRNQYEFLFLDKNQGAILLFLDHTFNQHFIIQANHFEFCFVINKISIG
ncbi:MAG: hypothetical protein JWP81_76 [Ferruginibacter sp.]|nr:hypothetical protein [Ferruginibacter sp.]